MAADALALPANGHGNTEINPEPMVQIGGIKREKKNEDKELAMAG